jgi:glyceraldehyde-3-phosphate dehydrogenase/erythrose-4-phosphate dehydrogenase
MKKASETYLKGVLAYTEDEVVSSDFIHCPPRRSSTGSRHRAEQQLLQARQLVRQRMGLGNQRSSATQDWPMSPPICPPIEL